jgi:hypothetical protein
MIVFDVLGLLLQVLLCWQCSILANFCINFDVTPDGHSASDDTGQSKLKLLTDKSRANLEYTKPFQGGASPSG